MEDLHRFVLLRPASAVDADRVISLSQDTPFQRALIDAVQADSPAAAAVDVAATYARGKHYTPQPIARAGEAPGVRHLVFGAALSDLARLLGAARAARPFEPASLARAVREAFAQDAAEASAQAGLQDDRRRAADSLITIKLLKHQQHMPVTDLALAIRLIALIDDLAAGRARIADLRALDDVLARPLVLPDAIFPLVKPHPAVRAAGIGDLLLIRQTLVRYEAGDVAHIENVLRGETKIRDHLRRTVIEETTTLENQTERDESRELESTERFELQREVAETVREETSLEGGLKVFGSYGPMVQFEAHASGTIAGSRDRSVKFAAEHASEVTTRASSRVAERIRQQRVRRVLQETEEKNHHELAAGGEHVIGVYQWVDKVYEAQVFNHGARTMFDFTVPEPAAYLIQSFASRHASKLRAPEPFALTPQQIDEDNYGEWVARYEVLGVLPPPDIRISVAKVVTLGAQQVGEPGPRTHAEELLIPADYEAVSADVWLIRPNAGLPSRVSVVIGTHSLSERLETEVDQPHPNSASVDLAGERGTAANLPLVVSILDPSQPVALSIEIWCRRTDAALERWRHTTYAAILQAYQEQRSDYEEKLAAESPPQGITIAGRNPASNRALERDELKKACITLLRGEYLGVTSFFDALAGEQVFPLGPQVDLRKSGPLGALARFFEQAFEWQHLAYVFYPYYWAHISRWQDRIAFADDDPLFESFMKAGAARVVVPVRRGFENAVSHFMDTGEIWEGGELPAIGSALFVPIDVELREKLGAPGNEVAQGEPWELRLPTQLVRLRPDGSLPSWHKDDSGRWLVDAPA